MYYLTLRIGREGVLWHFDLERLDIVVMMVVMNLSGDLRLDKLGGVVMDGLMDDGYQP